MSSSITTRGPAFARIVRKRDPVLGPFSRPAPLLRASYTRHGMLLSARSALEARRRRELPTQPEPTPTGADAPPPPPPSSSSRVKPKFFSSHRLLRNVLATTAGAGSASSTTPATVTALVPVEPVPSSVNLHGGDVGSTTALSPQAHARAIVMAAFARHETRRLETIARMYERSVERQITAKQGPVTKSARFRPAFTKAVYAFWSPARARQQEIDLEADDDEEGDGDDGDEYDDSVSRHHHVEERGAGSSRSSVRSNDSSVAPPPPVINTPARAVAMEAVR